MKRRLFCFVFAALFALPLAVRAQDGAPAGDIVKLNEEGIAAYQAGRFEEAATKFRQAYAIQPENTLKKNEAVAWFKAGRCEEALTAGREFLALPEIDELSQVEARAVVLQCDLQLARAATDAGQLDKAEQHVASARMNQPDPQAVEQLAKLETEIAAKREAEEAAKAQAAADAEARRNAKAAAAAAAADDDRSGSTSTLGLGLTAGGGAILVGTVVYHAALLFSTAPKFRDVAAAGADRAQYDRLGKKLETANWLIPTLYAVGAVTTGVGVWLWLQPGGEGGAPATASVGGHGDPPHQLHFLRVRELGINVGWRF